MKKPGINLLVILFWIFIFLLIPSTSSGCSAKKTDPPASPTSQVPSPGKPSKNHKLKAPDVLIVKSPASIGFFGWKAEQELEGAGNLLDRLGVKYGYIDEARLQDEKIPCKILILANTRCMEPKSYEAIRRFVGAGGKLLATYMAGYRDSENQIIGKENNFALTDLYGVDFSAWTQGKPNCEYMLTAEGKKIQLGRNQAMLIKARPGVKVLARWLKTDGSSQQSGTNSPAVVFNEKAGVIYTSEDLLAPENSRSPQVAGFMACLLNALSPGSAPIIPKDDEKPKSLNLSIPDSIQKGVLPGGDIITVGLKDPFETLSISCQKAGVFTSKTDLITISRTRQGETAEIPEKSLKTKPGGEYQLRCVAVVGKAPYVSIYTGGGKLLAKCSGSVIFKPDSNENPVFIYEAKPNGTYSYRVFRGYLEFFPNSNGKLLLNNHLSLEEYLAGVVPSEMPASYPAEALKAMAVTARTFALSLIEKGKHKSDGYHVCDQIHCQVYQGMIKERPSSNDAISKTRGIAAKYGGTYPLTTFHATNGGYGARTSSVWSGDLPYLQGGFDGPGEFNGDLSSEEQLKKFIDSPPETYDKKAGRFRWSQTYTKTELAKMLNESLGELLGRGRPVNIGKLYSISITGRFADGRARAMEIVGSEGTYTLEKDKMRWITSGGRISTGGLQSTLFYIKDEGDRITFTGGGWGHGVGLSQEGARGRALSGQTFRDILNHYYKGVKLEQIY